MKFAVTSINCFHDWVGRIQDADLTPVLTGMHAEVEARFNGGDFLTGTVMLTESERAALQAVFEQIAQRWQRETYEQGVHELARYIGASVQKTTTDNGDGSFTHTWDLNA